MAEGTEHLLKDHEMTNLYDPKENGHRTDNDDSSPSSPRLNRKALVVFFGVTIVAAAIIICTVMISVYSGKGGPFSNRLSRSSNKFGFDDIFSGRFSAGGYSAKWISDDEYITKTGEGIVLMDMTKNTSRVLLDSKKQESLGISGHWFSPDRKYLLFIKERQQQYRYSFLADYYIYDIENGGSPVQIKPGSADDNKIQYASWSNKNNALVIVYKYDIYYMATAESQIRRLTDSGVEHTIFNGIPDWVYQEEVLNSDHALWFSPEDSSLAYVQFNDTSVPWYRFPWYGKRENSYTEIRKIAYPKPGYPNPTVKVFFIDLQSLPQDIQAPVTKMEFVEPTEFNRIDHYLVNFAWGSDKIAAVTWLNRNQDNSILLMCDASSSASGLCKENYNLKVEGGWIDDKYSNPLFSSDGQYYIKTWPFPYPQAVGKFHHLAKLSTTQPNTDPDPLTSGAWEVTKILAHDDVNEIVYFSATRESPTELHVYSVAVTTKKLTCLTCNLPSIISDKNKCSYYVADFSLKGSWYVLYCRGPDIPEITLRSTKTDTVVILQDNKELRKRLKGVSLPTSEIFSVTNPSGHLLYYKEHHPPNFDPEKKYAVLFPVYGGPGSQKVIEAYGYGFEGGYLVSNYDIIVVEVDARGTCCRGESFEHQVYKHLGKYEAEDTVFVAEYLKKENGYVDGDKMAIWGWSYGGFLTTYALGTSSVFAVGMAVAPVTDWRYYDSIYTERYMLRPKDNLDGYEESSVLRLAANFKNDSFLLVHGTGDDNVHFQNTAQLVGALTKAGIKYQVQFYPDRNHGLSGGGTTDHLYHLLTRFLVENLSLVAS